MFQHKKTVAAAIGLLLLTFLLLRLPAYLTPVPTATFFEDSSSFGASSLLGDSLGFLLIDIQSEATANHYHVMEFGVYVLAVEEGSAAYKAGLRSGDQILAIGDRAVFNSADVNEFQSSYSADDPIELAIQRGGTQYTFTLWLPIKSVI